MIPECTVESLLDDMEDTCKFLRRTAGEDIALSTRIGITSLVEDINHIRTLIKENK